MSALRAAALALALVPALAAAGPRRTLAVAAAANARPALEELARAFEAERPDVEVRLTFAASGTLYAQIAGGARHDVFFSADRDYPRKLVAEGLAEGEAVYAVGELVLWVPREGRGAVAREGIAALARPEVRRVAIPNPRLAPYGRAALAALRAAGVLAAVEPKLVVGESVAQAAQFAHAGAADAAFVSRSLALTPALAGAGFAVPVAPGAHPPLEQSAVLLLRGEAPDLARALLAFVRGEKGRAILARAGYGLP